LPLAFSQRTFVASPLPVLLHTHCPCCLVALGPMASARSASTRAPSSPRDEALCSEHWPAWHGFHLRRRCAREDGQKYELKLARQVARSSTSFTGSAIHISRCSRPLRPFPAGQPQRRGQELRSRAPSDVLHTNVSEVESTDSVIRDSLRYRTKGTKRMALLRESGTHERSRTLTAYRRQCAGYPGSCIPVVELRDAALSLGAGGVGITLKVNFST